MSNILLNLITQTSMYYIRELCPTPLRMVYGPVFKVLVVCVNLKCNICTHTCAVHEYLMII